MESTGQKQPLEDFKGALSITQVATTLGLNPVRGKIRCFHPTRHSNGDRTPSVSISEEKGLFRCWVCPDVKGDVIELVSQVNNLSFKESLDWLASHFPSAGALLHTTNRHSSNTGRMSTIKAREPSSNPMSPIILNRPEHWREKTILSFLKMLAPIDSPDPQGHRDAQQYLMRRKIFQKTWTAMRLRWVDDYGRINDSLKKEIDSELLKDTGLVNDNGNLRFYKHRLIIPYLDAENRPLHFQARALDSETMPKELSLKGRVPIPFNGKILDEVAGWVYLCEGPIDAMTLIEKGLPAVGVPGVQHLKEEWIPLFKNKKVVVCYDNDEAGNTASTRVISMFQDQGIEASRLDLLPDGTDINDWFVRSK